MTEVVKPSATKIATKWALINLVVSIVLTYTYNFLDIPQESPARYLSIIPFFAFLLLAQKEYRDSLGGFITFGKAFSAGFRYAVFGGLIGALFVYLYTKVLAPDVYAASMEKAENDMAAKNMSEQQIETAMSFMKKNGHWIGAFIAAVFSTIIGLIASLIGAAIFKKEPSVYDFEDEVKDEPAV